MLLVAIPLNNPHPKRGKEARNRPHAVERPQVGATLAVTLMIGWHGIPRQGLFFNNAAVYMNGHPPGRS